MRVCEHLKQYPSDRVDVSFLVSDGSSKRDTEMLVSNQLDIATKVLVYRWHEEMF